MSRAGHPSLGGEKTGRQVREGFLEEVASDPMKGKSVIQAGKRKGQARAVGTTGAKANNLQ